MTFSSYPGLLTSLDDYYILGTGLIMVQTTNTLFNTTMYDVVRPQSVLAWCVTAYAHALGNTTRTYRLPSKSRSDSGGCYTPKILREMKAFLRCPLLFCSAVLLCWTEWQG
jgi:hypothetical protein